MATYTCSIFLPAAGPLVTGLCQSFHLFPVFGFCLDGSICVLFQLTQPRQADLIARMSKWTPLVCSNYNKHGKKHLCCLLIPLVEWNFSLDAVQMFHRVKLRRSVVYLKQAVFKTYAVDSWLCTSAICRLSQTSYLQDLHQDELQAYL
jgi:hypothetical protein